MADAPWGIVDDKQAEGEISRKRALAQALLEQSMQGQNPTQSAGRYVVPFSPMGGINQLAQALQSRNLGKKADEQERGANAKKQATIAALAKQMGMNDQQLAAFQIAPETVTKEWAQAQYRAPEKQPQPHAVPSDIQEYQLWEGQGGKGGIEGFMRFKASLQPKPERMIPVFDPATGQTNYRPASQAGGGIVPPKAGAAPKLTEGELKSVTYGIRAASALKTIDELESGGYNAANPLDRSAENMPLGNAVKSKGGQAYSQAAREFITAILRRDSGATITPTEMDEQYVIYFPVYGDGPDVIKQKREARATAYEALKAGAGGGAAQLSGGAPQVPGANNDPLGIRNK